MRIAVCHNLPSGGGKRALYEIVSRLALRHEVDVYTLSTADHDYCDLRPYAHAYRIFEFSPVPLAHSPFGRINPALRTVDLYRLRVTYRAMAQEIDRGQYDLVFVHNCQFGQSPSLLQNVKTPSVYYCAEPPRQLYEPAVGRQYAQRSGLQDLADRFDLSASVHARTLKRLDQANTRHADMVLTNSAYSRETLYRTYHLLANVVYLGVDPERFRPIHTPKGDFVLSVGAVQPHKGFDFVIESLGRIARTIRPRLIVVGNASNQPEVQYLQDHADRWGVALEIKVRISDDELVQLYNQAALTVYAPVMEPFGFVPLESSACATPVVGVFEGGVRETVEHNCTGLLIERDADAFGCAVETLLQDEARRRQMGRNGREQALRRWSWERTVKTFERHFAALG